MTFFRQLILQEDIFGTPASLILCFLHKLKLSSSQQQLLFQQTYSLFFGMTPNLVNIYRNIDKGCEEIRLQFKELPYSRKLRKVVAIYKQIN